MADSAQPLQCFSVIQSGRSPDLAKTTVKKLPILSAILLPVCLALFNIAPVKALDVGFEMSARGALSDNIFQDNIDEEVDGSATLTELVVFGNHVSQRLIAGFQGELGLRRRFSDEEERDDSTTLTRFYGSAEFAVTRSFSWFFGDVLGGSRDNDTLITDDAIEEFENRRNVLVTGPQIEWQLDSVRNLEGHLYFIDSSDDEDTDFSQFFELEIDYTQQFQAGWLWGLRLENFFVTAGDQSAEPDFNRTTFGVTGVRSRDTNTWTGFLGATRYQTRSGPEFETDGLSGSLRFTRSATEASSFYVEVSRSIVDQTLSETQSLLDTGTSDGPDVPGIFNDTVLRAGYNFETTGYSLNTEFGVAEADFEAIFDGGALVDLLGDEEDQRRLFANLSGFYSLTPKLGLGGTLGHSNEEDVVGGEFIRSSFATLSLRYQISTSFVLRARYLHEILEGLATNDVEDEITDSVENRVFVSLTYAPPTRANRDEVERLRSLLF